MPDALFRPYVSLGGGAYDWESRVRVPDEGGQLVTSGWDLGWTADVGIEYYLRPKVAMDVAVRYHSTPGPGGAAGLEDDRLRFLAVWIGHYVRV